MDKITFLDRQENLRRVTRRLLVLHYSRASVRRVFRARDLVDESREGDLAPADRQLL